MLTDGNKLYLFARKRVKQKDSSEASCSIAVQIYQIERKDCKVHGFKYERQITLMKNSFDAFSKDGNSSTFVGTSAQWATNGQVLVCFSIKNRIICFDLENGLKISKATFWSSSESQTSLLIYFNY